ncbi:PKD-like family lipoprotein [Flavobacterium sp. FlaQc-30]|uniref:PKD-like family lipoprotein n=1 Tax=Flavobacterium sp. FlaQc-30 TaxID=3374179 RepID=UPI0037579F56
MNLNLKQKMIMLKNIKAQTVLLALLFLSVSCSDDIGNYNYKNINEIKATGIEKTYTVYSGDHLKIIPNLNPTLDDGNDPNRYTYEWSAVDPLIINPLLAKTVIAKTKNLDIDLKLAPAKYTIYYFVKDNATGVTWQQEPFTLTVISSIYEGWLALGDVDGKARLDMVSILPNVAEPKIITDVLEKSGSDLKLSGKAVNVYCFKNPLLTTLMYGIYVTASESGTSRIDQDSFGWTPTQNIAYEMVDGSIPRNFGVDFMKSALQSENFLYSKGNIYYFLRPMQIGYSLPQNKVDIETKPFYAAPFIAENGGSTGSPVFYDRDGHRFLRYICVSGICSKMPQAVGTGTILDWSNTNSDLVYMTTTPFNGYENFAVLKNISTGKYNLLRFNMGFVQTYYKEILNAPDFDKATHFAVSPDSGYLFYTVGSKLYEYDNGTQSAKLMLDKGAEEITYIGFHANSKTFANKLVVGSYSTTGTLELYTVPPVNGALVLTNSYTGLCKIVDVAFRAR